MWTSLQARSSHVNHNISDLWFKTIQQESPTSVTSMSEFDMYDFQRGKNCVCHPVLYCIVQLFASRCMQKHLSYTCAEDMCLVLWIEINPVSFQHISTVKSQASLHSIPDQGHLQILQPSNDEIGWTSCGSPYLSIETPEYAAERQQFGPFESNPVSSSFEHVWAGLATTLMPKHDLPNCIELLQSQECLWSENWNTTLSFATRRMRKSYEGKLHEQLWFETCLLLLKDPATVVWLPQSAKQTCLRFHRFSVSHLLVSCMQGNAWRVSRSTGQSGCCKVANRTTSLVVEISGSKLGMTLKRRSHDELMSFCHLLSCSHPCVKWNEEFQDVIRMITWNLSGMDLDFLFKIPKWVQCKHASRLKLCVCGLQKHIGCVLSQLHISAAIRKFGTPLLLATCARTSTSCWV